MILEDIIKFGTFILGAIGVGKMLYDISMGKRSRLREEYQFANEFLEQVRTNKQLHPFLREKGCQAIAGDNQVSPEEVEYLLSLKGPDRALKDFVLGRPYLEHLSHEGPFQVAFRAQFSGAWSRQWRKGFYLILYAVLIFSAFAPLLLSKFMFQRPAEMLIAFVGCVAVFGPYAWFSLQAATRIIRAENLVRNQHMHTQRILLSGTNLLRSGVY